MRKTLTTVTGKESKGRFGLSIVLALLVVAVAAPARADPTSLFLSEDFELRARLTGTKLVLAHVNLTNLPLEFRCRTDFEGELYGTHGFLAPHLVWRDRYRSDALRLRGASATCTVTVDDSFTVLWEGQLMEVLGKGFVDESGEPGTYLIFQNISAETVRYGCTWDMGDPPTSYQHGSTHQPAYTFDSISFFSIDFSTVTNMKCTEEVYDP